MKKPTVNRFFLLVVLLLLVSGVLLPSGCARFCETPSATEGPLSMFAVRGAEWRIVRWPFRGDWRP
jgi:hypothetical protein